MLDSKSSEKSLVTAIDHCSLIVTNTSKAIAFYTDILSLTVDESRPDLGYPGAWLMVASSQIHLLEVPNPYSTVNRPKHGGRDHHIALTVTNLDVIVQRLKKKDIDYSMSKSGRAALFFRDLDGNVVELVEK